MRNSLFKLMAIVMMFAAGINVNAQNAVMAKKAAPRKVEMKADVAALAQKAKDAKALQAVKAEKAAAAEQTSTSVLRRSVKNNDGLAALNSGKVLEGVKFNSARNAMVGVQGAKKSALKKASLANKVASSLLGLDLQTYQFKSLTNSFYPFVKQDVAQTSAAKAPRNAGETVTAADVEGSYDFKYYGALNNNNGWQTGKITVIATSDTELEFVGFFGTYPVKATLASDGTVTLATNQYLTYNANNSCDVYFATKRWNDNGQGNYFTESIVATYADGTITFDDYDIFMITAGIGESLLGYFNGGYYMSMVKDDEYVAPSTELVTVPEGTEIADWYMNAETSDEENTITNLVVKVGANENNEFYVQGLCTNFPDAWVKGTFDDATGIITFEKGQYVGSYYGVADIWFMGFDGTGLSDVTATYDYEANTITFNEFILENAEIDEIYFLEYYYDVVLSMEKVGEEPGEEPGDEPSEVTVTTDANGIITNVTGGTPKYYTRSNDGTAYFVSSGSMYIDAQSGTVTTIEDDDVVYIKNPITRYTQNSWVKGTKADGKITIATKQPLAYNSTYDATISLRWGVVDAEGSISVVDDHAEAFTFTIDGDKLILEGTAAWDEENPAVAYYMGAFWDDDDSATGYGDAETVLTLDEEFEAPVAEPVVVPADAEVAEWYMNGTDDSGKAVKNRVVKVASDGEDFYVQGLAANFPEAWVKGTYDEIDGVVKFKKNQWIGFADAYGLDIWFLGFDTTVGDICDATAVYEFENSTITFNEQLLINGSTERKYYLEYYDDVVLSMDPVEFVEPTLTDLTAELPYYNSFDTEAEQAEVAIYDANEDGKTFIFQDGAAKYSYSSANDGDDYLVFPGLALEAGKTYKVTVDARAQSTYYDERFEVVVGNEAKASKLSTVVIPATDVLSTDYETFSNVEFAVEEDGVYYFAVHGISEADKYYLYVDNFSVKENDILAPAAVSDLTVVADEAGANKALVTFTTPTVNLAGEELNTTLGAEIKRNGEDAWYQNCGPGQKVEFEDNVPAPGYYVYTVTITDMMGQHVSEAASVKAYIGEDTPGVVEDLIAADNANNTVSISWNAPSEGANNGILIPANLTYNVYPVTMEELWGIQFPVTDYDNPYVTGLKATDATVNYDTNVGAQDYTYFAVTAENTAGESKDTYAAVLTGAPYTLPFIETLPGALTYWWGGDVDDENYDLDGGIMAAPTTEDENGDLAFAFDAKTAGWMELYSGKIALSGKAALSFDYTASTAVTEMKLYVSAPGKEDVLLAVVEPWIAPTSDSEAEVVEGTFSISLKDFVSDPWVRLTLRAEFSEEGTLLVDNVAIIGFDNELVAKGITAPAKIEANKEFNVAVTVANEGANVAEGYTVELYKNGEKVAEQAGEAIASAANATVTFAQTLSIVESDATYKAVVVYDIDENEANNETSEIVVAVKLPNYPAVNDLAATQDNDGVKLTWSEPNLEAGAPEYVTETFEDAESFAQTVDGWTFVDGDGAPAGGIQDVDIPGHVAGSGLLSWFVFDTDLNESYAGLSHSGNKHMSTMFNYPVGNVTPANDDWMISPALYGGAQTISFWATELTDRYGNEKMEVLYSTTDKELSSFTSLGVVDVEVEWHEFTFDLPEGAKYFAIRYVSQDIFMLWVDDVTFIPAEGASAELALVGYNVYRDGELIAENVAETEYTDAEANDGSHTYVVTVVYEQGESAPSNVVTVDVVTGISEINAAAAAGKTYTIDGCQVNSARNGLYIIERNGKMIKTVK